jgi:hypothetical protein
MTKPGRGLRLRPSGADECIGGGATVDYTDPTVTVSSSLITANVGGWTLDLAAPAGGQLTAGTTVRPREEPARARCAPGVHRRGADLGG